MKIVFEALFLVIFYFCLLLVIKYRNYKNKKCIAQFVANNQLIRHLQEDSWERVKKERENEIEKKVR